MIKTIVVADDERSNALLLARRLEKEGFTVFTAGNGVEALEIINTRKIDLLITDVVMPEMDGVDLYLEIKNNPLTNSLPIIIVTDKEAFQESFSALGVELYSPKPFVFTDLLAKIRKIEANFKEDRPYHKVVVIGPDKSILEKMRDELQKHNSIVAMVDNVVEIGLRCFLINPHLIILDLCTRDYATTKEIIKSLRAYNFFRKTRIVIFSYFSAEDAAKMGNLDNIEMEINACIEAGANKYVGRFNRVTFIEQLGDELSTKWKQ